MTPRKLLLGCLAASVLCTPLYAEDIEAIVVNAPTAIEVEAKPYELSNSGTPLTAGSALGALTFNTALKLTSHTYVFGGISGLSAAGEQIFAVTDEGYMLRAKLNEKEGALTGLKDVTMAAIWPPNQPPKRKHDYDAEGLTWMKKGAQFMVSFEQDHRLVHYDFGDKPYIFRTHSIPESVTSLITHRNKGIEAIAPLDDKRMIALAEDSRDPEGNLRGWIIEEKQWNVFTLKATEAFSPTDIAVLPNGDALLLERSYSIFGGMMARISQIKKDDLKAGAVIETKELARFGSGSGIDNMEGFTLLPGKDGAMTLLLISDDNSNPLQNTLLVSLTVPKEIVGTAAKAAPAKKKKK